MRRLREAEALRVLPRAVDQHAEEQRRDIGQHQAGQDLVDLEAGLEEGRDRRLGHAAEDAGEAHQRQDPASPSSPQNASATPPPAIAPTVSWPSAPMFQTLARKPIARPTRDHDQRRRLDRRARPGRRGSSDRRDEEVVERRERVVAHEQRTGRSRSTTVSATASSGVSQSRPRAGLAPRLDPKRHGRRLRSRAAARSSMPCSPPISRPISSSEASARDAARRDSTPSLITASRSVSVSSSSRSCEITRTAAPRAARSTSAWWIAAAAPASTPQVGCDDDQHARVLQDLAADDEFLQVAAGQRARPRPTRRAS